ncbi:SspB family protein [Roseibium salinum]|uniref:SspB family protein n=1 Tax=Roseibium salinum TaxID=1604349 RepID=A0ABT3QYA9_9HYPH|nr:SspB family protein [Roseibium sp. DSM 29163]MCX2721904.1 SspB family protein [Roseibium sp. DSM 29163]MDN3720053.1 SspB family protein [Roseibium salinum]
MSEDLLRYDILIQDALRGAVKKILAEVGRTGLPGDHHFYIAFDTNAPGVRVSQRLKERYPQEMTIVLQHQFWDLAIGEHAFEVGLSFGGVPEKLLVPFSAIKGFFDPSVQFALEFDPGKTAEELPEELLEAVEELARAEQEHAESEAKAEDGAGGREAASSEPKRKKPKAAAEAADNAASGEVVSLDAFRKKT